MINVFGEEEFRPITKFGKEIPHYFVAKDGRVLSTKTSNHKILNPKYESVIHGYKVPHMINLRVNRKQNPELCEEYEYTTSQQNLNIPGSKYYKKLTKNPDLISIHLKYHRAVMEAWKPIDDYPPIPKKDWDECPESAKQFMRDAAIIDHIDNDTRNNHVDNLRWTTNKDNNPDRKKQQA